jgi:ubiquinone/menaquinone biosynthesis C-methylase UbiE
MSETFQDAARYDRSLRLLERFGIQGLRRRLLAPLSGLKVLEVGAGTGANLAHYPHDTRVVSSDVNLPMLRGLQRKTSLAPPVCADVTRLPFPTGRFDVVVSTLVFCSVADPLAGLAEIGRVLGPHGRLLMIEHVRGQRPLTRILTDWLHPLWFRLQGECHLNRETGVLVRQAGFRLLSQRSHGAGLLLVVEAQNG